MIFDHRTYTCRPGTLKKHLKLYGEHGFVPQSRHLGKPLLYGFVETGNVNSYVHIWIFKDTADRAARRSAMAADPEWQAYLKLSAEAGNLVSQVNQIISPTEFYDMPEIG